MPTVGREVKFLDVVVEVVLLEEGFEFLLGGEFDSARTVDVNVPATSLLTVLATFQLANPSRRQRLVLELEHFRQVGRPTTDLHPVAATAVVVTSTTTHARRRLAPCP